MMDGILAHVLSKRQNTSNPVGSHLTASKTFFADDSVLNGDDG